MMWNNDGHFAGPGNRSAAELLAARASGTGPEQPAVQRMAQGTVKGTAKSTIQRKKSGHSAALVGKTDALGALAVFDGCGGDALLRLAEASTLHRLRRGASLDRGRIHGHLVGVVRGFVRTSIASETLDGELILDVFGKGDVVSDWCWGQGAVAGDGAVVAVEDAVMMLTPRKALETLLVSDGETSIRFVRLVAVARARAIALATQNACLGVGDRLYCRLVELAHRRGKVTAKGVLVEHGLAQWELAAFTSASRENVNRQLNDWRARGWIELERRGFLLRDPQALSQAVAPAARRVGFGAGDGRLPLHAA